MSKPNILFLMCDQFRFDCIAALGNSGIHTPNLDRLVRRGVSFSNAYSPCPVCVPARYIIRTGRGSHTLGYFSNSIVPVEVSEREEKWGNYLARSLRDSGYFTFGIGKFHTVPVYEDLGFDVHKHSEETWSSNEIRTKDAYAAFIAEEHPEYSFIEQLHGERTEMYYMPQTSPLPKELTVENWVAEQTIAEIEQCANKPYFGFVSFIGPHPPCAPPVPYNRYYNPDNMPAPVGGDLAVDHADPFLPNMNYKIWADGLNDFSAKIVKARYYGEITYIDHCIGKILDAVESRADADNTLICFFTDHGDHLGDHHAWQKESFFEQSAKIPFLLSWPDQIQGDTQSDSLVSLLDLFGIATKAAGCMDVRDGVDVLGCLAGKNDEREYLFGYHSDPGTLNFKMMIRHANYKYIYIANGGRELLFNLAEDPCELSLANEREPEMLRRLRLAGIAECSAHTLLRPALENHEFKKFDYQLLPLKRIRQFDTSRGVTDFIVGK